ncbi:MAG TPA: hypothetical protein VNQ73_07570 [Ilumatobacter sp.]|nr:hypothetical protein [Ilumatobacter sp.]
MDEHDLIRRLHSAADTALTDTTVSPDLTAVERAASQVRGRRRWATGVAAAMLVAGAGGAGFGLGHAAGSGSDQAASEATGDPVEPPSSEASRAEPTPEAAPDTETPSAEPASDADASPAPAPTPSGSDAPAGEGTMGGVVVDASDGPAPMPYPGAGTGYGDPYALAYTRQLADGTRVRALIGGAGWYGMGEWGVAGWEPAPWCYPQGELRITLDAPDLVDLVPLGHYASANPATGVVAQRAEAGLFDGRPVRVVVVQSTETVTSVTVRWDDGAADTAAVESSIAVLVVPGDGAWNRTFELDVTTAEGTTTFTSDQVDSSGGGGAAHRAACLPPPPALPEAGEQPADPAGGWSAIQAAMDTLWNGELAIEQRLAVLDDQAGIADALAELQQGSYAEAAASAVFTIDEHVFTSPTEAWFRYSIDTNITDFSERYGTATLVDGQWLLRRAMFCADLALAGAQCQPAEPAVYPPSWYERNGQSGYGGCDPDGVSCWSCSVYADGTEECYDETGELVDGPPADVDAAP